MGQKKKNRSTEFLQQQIDEELSRRIANRVKRIKENLMQDYLNQRRKEKNDNLSKGKE